MAETSMERLVRLLADHLGRMPTEDEVMELLDTKDEIHAK